MGWYNSNGIKPIRAKNKNEYMKPIHQITNAPCNLLVSKAEVYDYIWELTETS